ncbi:MAG: hypothetical protein AAF125_05685 [Chloroflexota bacterium]
MSEATEFEEIASNYDECSGVKPGAMGCACTGRCLGSKLAKLRQKYDAGYEGDEYWWSDQAHGGLKKRPGDSGRHGAPLNAENYWTGAN